MKFQTQYREHERFYTNAGERFQAKYKPTIDKVSKKLEVVKTKENDDIYSFINSFAEATDMNVLINKFLNGDKSAMNQGSPKFGDFTELPKNLMEAQQLLIDAENDFNKMPIDIKNKFDNSFEYYIQTIGSDEWLSALGLSKETPTTEPVVENLVKEENADA